MANRKRKYKLLTSTYYFITSIYTLIAKPILIDENDLDFLGVINIKTELI